MLRRFVFLVGAALSLSAGQLRAAPAEHVVLVVWDGMRPDFVRETDSPNLWRMAEGGVRFLHHHSVYPSLTSVNATALATGVFPNRSGVLANWVYRPEIIAGKLARMDAAEVMQEGDRLSGGHYLLAPTIAEMVQAAGGRTAIAGTKTASLLHDRLTESKEREATASTTLFRGTTFPGTALAVMQELLGLFPEPDAAPNVREDEWTTRALTEVLWKDGVPRFSLLWLSDPDRSQHATAPGSAASLAGIRSADANLGRVLRALEAKGVRETTDVLLASDHGFSTIARRIDLEGFLRKAGLLIAGEADSTLARGRVRIAGNGGTVFFYVGEHDSGAMTHLIETLQQSDFAGVIFAREKVEGVFPMSLVHLDTPGSPDVVMSFRWTDKRNAHGVPGLIDTSAGADANQATHGSLSPFDLHNTFIAAGPDFQQKASGGLPTSNLDVAATIMHILGLTPPERIDGRVVTDPITSSSQEEVLAVSRAFSSGRWTQELRTTKLGDSLYLDQGRGQFRAP